MKKVIVIVVTLMILMSGCGAEPLLPLVTPSDSCSGAHSLYETFEQLEREFKATTEDQEIMKILKILINDELWYHGVASPLHMMVNQSFFVCARKNYSAGENVISFLLAKYSESEADGLVFSGFWQLTAKNYYSPIYVLEEVLDEKYNLGETRNTYLISELLEGRADGINYYPYGKITVEPPIKPDYFDCDAKSLELQTIKDIVTSSIQNAGFEGDCKVYVQDYFNIVH